MQNAKKFALTVEGRTDRAGAGASPPYWEPSKTISPTSPSSRSAPAPQNRNHFQCQQWLSFIIRAQCSAWGFFPGFGSSAEQPLG